MITTVLGECVTCGIDTDICAERGTCDRCRAGEPPVRWVTYRDPLAPERANPYRWVDGYMAPQTD